ncbi:MAG: TetR/AcrR family transcriptional regulator [Akkermansia sp.]
MENITQTQHKTQRKIVEAAIELMSNRGFHRVSVQEVGEKAGMCEKTVFRYFPTKKALLEEIVRYRSYAHELKTEFERKRTWHLDHDLKLAFRLYFQATKSKRNAFRAYLSALDSIDMNGEDFLKDSHEVQSFLGEYIAEMQRRGYVQPGDPLLMARALVNTLHGYMLMYCLNDDEKAWQTKVASIKLTINLFIQGFAQENI